MPIHLPPISRRRFLAGTLAAGAATLLPGGLEAAKPAGDPNHWVLLSDTHIWEFRDKVHRGTKPAETFAAIRQEVLAQATGSAGAIITGDCAYLEGQPGDYSVLVEELKPLREAGLPIHLLLGNHDHREHFLTAFPEAKVKSAPAVADRHVAVLETPHANWFLLDSLEKTNHTPGQLGESQLKWLAVQLDARPDKPAIVVAHHHLDRAVVRSGLTDTKALLEVLRPRKHVKAYVFGHSHKWAVSEQDGLHLVNLPATAWLFDDVSPRGWVDSKVAAGGMTLVLSSLDKRHPKHGEKIELKWRA